MKSIFHYFNYREYLRDFLKEQARLENANFSHRFILKKMGITSSGFLANVLASKANLTAEQSRKLGDILKLNRREKKYYLCMIEFTQAKSVEEKTSLLNVLSGLQKTQVNTLSWDQFGLFAKWHYPIVRELITVAPFKDDYKMLAKMFDPPIRPGQVKDAIAALESLGLVQKNKKGEYEQTSATVSTGDDIASLQVLNFQLEAIERAREALKRMNVKQRNISVSTLGLSAENYVKIKARLRDFEKEILDMAGREKNPENVYHLNFNFFPVTKNSRGQK